METNDVKSKEKEILRKIFIREEDTLKDLDFIVEESLKHFKINLSSEKKIIFERHINKVLDKINLCLIGLYLMNKGDESKSLSINLATLSKYLSVKNTSLSKPLGILINKGYVKKDNSGNYSIEHHKIKEILEGLKNE